MGIQGLWSWLKKKKIEPTPGLQFKLETAKTIHLDLLGAFFSTIVHAYSNNKADVANVILESVIAKIGNKSNLVIYIDGQQCQEKLATQNSRQMARVKAQQQAQTALDVFCERTTNGQRIKKQHFAKVRKPLRGCYRWSSEEKKACSVFLRSRGWSVIDCPAEADVEIAKVCGPGDAVASRDGDFFAYQQVQTIWRVVGFGARANVHCYHVQEVLLSLGLTRDQLTALCVVTGNDYNKNISTLGICTNYELIKDITAGQDVAAIVSDYLGLESVMLKNAALTTFDDSLRVFIGLTQTPITTPGGQQTDSSDHYHRLLKEFDDARLQLKERQKTMAAEKRHQKLRHNSIPNTSNHSSIDPPITEHRPRYSFKTRQTAKLHERPQTLLQYKWKESKSLVPDQIPAAPVQDIPDMAAKRRKMIEGRRTDKLTATSNKKMILTALEYEHPFAVLRLGLLEGNVKKALPNQPDAAQEVVGCLRAAVCDAWSIKRRCQEIISIYLAKVSSFSVVSEKDRQILDQLCPRLTKDDFKQPGDGTVDESSNKDAGTGDSADKNANFLHSFMSALHSGNRPGSKALLLVERLRDKEFEGILQPFEIGLPGTVNQNDDRFPASSLTRSVSGQMYVELKKHFKHGTVNLYHKLEVIQKRDPSSPTVPINYNLSAVENFWRLNKLLHNPWKPFPLSSVEVGFVTFTEYELGGFFFNSRYPCLRTKLRQDMKEAFPRTPEESLNKTTLVEDHLPKTRFGHLTEMLVAKVGSDGLTRRQRDRAGLEAAIDNLSLDDIKRHINELREEDFDPRAYKGKGYIMRGSIKTDGHELQLLVHKKKELLGVRYKRFPDDRLPNRLLSTMGGADYYLTEVRNVFKSAQDVQDLLGCSPDQVRQEVTVLGIDHLKCTTTLLLSRRLFISLLYLFCGVFYSRCEHWAISS
ncbi:hypothetical protein EDD21DRAFT_383772 [Dissophora ornata]|nr:hypothetical protein EDD21DRAFT_383772 [Dissophora ornata]